MYNVNVFDVHEEGRLHHNFYCKKVFKLKFVQIWRNEILNETWIIIIHNGSTLQGDYTVKIASTGTGL